MLALTRSALAGPARSLGSLGAVLLAATLAGCGAADDPAIDAVYREVPAYSIGDFLETTAVIGASFSPDNSKVLVSSDERGVYNAYAIPIDGGEPVRLTDSEESVFVVSYFPTDERILYLSDRGGNELHHLYVRDPDGAVRDLTPGENLKATFAGWAQDDRSFFVATNERDARYFDLYEYSADDYTRELIYRNEDGLDVGAISPDKRYLALVKPITTANSDIYLLDRSTGERQHLTPHDGDVQNSPQTFSRDGASLYYTSDEGVEFQRLLRYDLEAGSASVVLAPEWDIWFASFSKDGRYFVTGTNVDGRTRIDLYEGASMEPVALPDVGEADVTSVTFSRDASRLAFYASGSRFPSDLFVTTLPGSELRRLTTNLNPAIDSENLVDGQVVRFASYDGVEVPGILYRPHTATAETQAPALVWVHGGPGGQSRIGYSNLIQYLVNHGYVVYAINNRGSSGYGKTFYKMDDRRHGEADLGDVVASKSMLAETGFVDPARIGIIGGSYGGYMVLAALTLQPEAFVAGVDLFGISNWIRTLESIPPWWESFKEALYTEMGDPATDRERLTRISPLFNADRIVRPLMVLQGANDPRVLKVESDEIVEAARANGVPVEYLVFEDEGHGFVKKENQRVAWAGVLSFLDEHLKGDVATPIADR
ncbi:MAG: alpha/beta fold hydrolase [Longimicrobiales bacterium]